MKISDSQSNLNYVNKKKTNICEHFLNPLTRMKTLSSIKN